MIHKIKQIVCTVKDRILNRDIYRSTTFKSLEGCVLVWPFEVADPIKRKQ